MSELLLSAPFMLTAGIILIALNGDEQNVPFRAAGYILTTLGGTTCLLFLCSSCLLLLR